MGVKLKERCGHAEDRQYDKCLIFALFETWTPEDQLAWGNCYEYGIIFWLIIPVGCNTARQSLFVCAVALQNLKH